MRGSRRAARSEQPSEALPCKGCVENKILSLRSLHWHARLDWLISHILCGLPVLAKLLFERGCARVQAPDPAAVAELGS